MTLPLPLLLLLAPPCPDPLAPKDVRMALEEQVIPLVAYGAHAGGAVPWDLPRDGNGLERLLEGDPGFRNCYLAALEREPELEGTWTVRVTIATDGALGEPGVVSAAKSNPRLERCIGRALAGRRVEWSLAPRPETFDFALRFAKKASEAHEQAPHVRLASPPILSRRIIDRDPLPWLDPFPALELSPLASFEVLAADPWSNDQVKVTPGCVDLLPAVFREDLLRAIQSNIGAYRECFGAGSRGGRDTYRLEVDPFGRVSRTTSGPERWTACVAAALREVRFPTGALQHGTRLHLEVPLRFVPSHEPAAADPRMALAQGNADYARVDFLTALSMAPNDLRGCDWQEGLLESAVAEDTWMGERASAAAEAFVDYLDAHPWQAADCTKSRAGALLRWATQPHLLAQRYGRRALLRVALKRYRLLERLGNDFPNAVEVAFYSGEAQWSLEEWTGAAASYRRTLELGPELKRAFAASQAWYLAAREADALPELQRATRNFVDRFPDDTDAQSALANTLTHLAATGHGDDALRELYEIRRDHPHTRCGDLAEQVLNQKRQIPP